MTSSITTRIGSGILALLNTDPQLIRKKTEKSYQLATAILRTYGLKHKASVESLPKKLQKDFTAIRGGFAKIQELVRRGDYGFNPVNLDKTANLLDKYSNGRESAYSEWKRCFYETLPFPQAMLGFQNCEIDHFQEIENRRLRGVYLLLELLEDDLEEKKASTQEQSLSKEDEFALTQSLYNGGAVVTRGKTYYFFELLDIWALFSSENSIKKDRLLNQISTNKWAPKSTYEFREFQHLRDIKSFREFLLTFSVESVLINLGIAKPNNVLIDHLQKKMSSESIRADLCYFSAKLKGLYSLEIPMHYTRQVSLYAQRDSKDLLKAIQLFLFLIREKGAPRDEWTNLFTFLITTNMKWEVYREIPGFAGRQWGEIQPSDQSLVQSICSTRAILQDCVRRSREGEGAEEYILRHPHSAAIIIALWKVENRDEFVQNLKRLTSHKAFSFKIENIYDFIYVNPQMDLSLFEFYIQKYLDVIKVFEEERIDLSNAQYLMLCPAENAEVIANHANFFDSAPDNVREFLRKIKPYQLPLDLDFLKMVRQYIFNPTPRLFDLLDGIDMIGIRIDKSLLNQVFRTGHGIIGSVEVGLKNQAIHIAQWIQRQYQLQPSQILFIYFKLYRDLAEEGVDSFRKGAQFIAYFNRAFPVGKEEIYQLFIHLPTTSISKLNQLKLELINWAQSSSVNRFIIPSEKVVTIEQKCESLIDSMLSDWKMSEILSERMQQEGAKMSMRLRLKEAMLYQFIQPMQPLTEQFRIEGFELERGIQWIDEVRRLKEGQFVRMSKNGPVVAFFHWDLWGKKLGIRFTILNQRTKNAASATEFLRIPYNQITKDTYRAIFELSKVLMHKEEADLTVSEDDVDEPSHWLSSYKNAQACVSNLNITQTQITQILNFFKKLKVSYRKCFYSCVLEKPIIEFSDYNLIKLASQGHIYTTDKYPDGVLLDPSILDMEQNQKHFLPDLSPVQIETLRNLFAERNDNKTILNIDFSLKIGKQRLFYKVETKADRLENKLSDSEEKMRGDVGLSEPEVKQRAENIDEGRYVTLWTLSGAELVVYYPAKALKTFDRFKEYVIFHFLQLKALAYQKHPHSTI